MKNVQNQRLSLFSVRKDLFIVSLTIVRTIKGNLDAEIWEFFASKIRNPRHWNPEFR